MILCPKERLVDDILTGRGSHDSLASRTKARCITSQPRNDTPKLVRSPYPPQGIRIGPFLQEVRLSIKVRRSHTVTMKDRDFRIVKGACSRTREHLSVSALRPVSLTSCKYDLVTAN